jgi:hypothetical protein
MPLAVFAVSEWMGGPIIEQAQHLDDLACCSAEDIAPPSPRPTACLPLRPILLCSPPSYHDSTDNSSRVSASPEQVPHLEPQVEPAHLALRTKLPPQHIVSPDAFHEPLTSPLPPHLGRDCASTSVRQRQRSMNEGGNANNGQCFQTASHEAILCT